MTGWWRRNAVAVGALAVLAPLTFGAIAWDGWKDFHLFQHTLPIDVADGEDIELVGATWGPIRASEITDTSGFDMPVDAKVIGAAIPVDPESEGPACFEPTLVQQGTGIRFPEARDELGLDESDEEPTRCVAGVVSLPYEMIVPFIVPSDAEGPFWVEVAPEDATPSVIRFAIDP